MRKKLRDLLNPGTAKLVDEASEEIRMLYKLAQRNEAALGMHLLAHARAVREDYPDIMHENGGRSLEASLFTMVVPELAVRLGVPRSKLRKEEGHEKAMALTNQQFRHFVNHHLKNINVLRFMRRQRKGRKPSTHVRHRNDQQPLTLSIAVLVMNVADGNPVAFALDTIAPPEPAEIRSYEDHIASTVERVSRNRGHEPTATWSPRLQEYPSPSDGAPALTP